MPMTPSKVNETWPSACMSAWMVLLGGSGFRLEALCALIGGAHWNVQQPQLAIILLYRDLPRGLRHFGYCAKYSSYLLLHCTGWCRA